MNIVNGAYYELIDKRVARIKTMAKYYPDDVVATVEYDSNGKITGYKDYWANDFKAIIKRRVQPCGIKK